MFEQSGTLKHQKIRSYIWSDNGVKTFVTVKSKSSAPQINLDILNERSFNCNNDNHQIKIQICSFTNYLTKINKTEIVKSLAAQYTIVSRDFARFHQFHQKFINKTRSKSCKFI